MQKKLPFAESVSELQGTGSITCTLRCQLMSTLDLNEPLSIVNLSGQESNAHHQQEQQSVYMYCTSESFRFVLYI